MKRWQCAILLSLLASSLAAPVRAQFQAQVQGPGLKMPLTALEGSYELTPGFGLRAWIGGRPGLLASDGVFSSSMLLADWHPGDGGFRLTGGLAHGAMRHDPTYILAPFALMDTSVVDPRSWLARSNPYLGVGWGLGAGPRGGLYLSADVGVMYTRNSLATWGCPAGLPAGACAPDLRALEAYAGDESRLAPMMSFGVGLRF
jgi:hypothetical protein